MQVEALRRNDEQSTLPSQPRLDPDDPGHYPALLDADPHSRVDILPELFLVGRVCGRIVSGRYRCCNMGEDEERVINPLPAQMRSLYSELLC